MSFSSLYVIKKILNVFKAETMVKYVAILDYEGSIKVHLVQDKKNISLLERRCISGVKAISKRCKANQKFTNQTELLTISNENDVELICFSNFIIYVISQHAQDDEKLAQLTNDIEKLAINLNKIFELEHTKLEKCKPNFTTNENDASGFTS